MQEHDVSHSSDVSSSSSLSRVPSPTATSSLSGSYAATPHSTQQQQQQQQQQLYPASFLLQHVHAGAAYATVSALSSTNTTVATTTAAGGGGGGHGDARTHDAVVRRALAAVAAMERDTALMTLFFRHMAQCPAHGPFRYYAALTFVERARRQRRRQRQCDDDDVTAQQQSKSAAKATSATAATAAAAAARRDDDGGDGDDDDDDFATVLTIPHVLTLMERYYNTNHLCNWPLLYVPASVHSRDVDALLQQQQQQP